MFSEKLENAKMSLIFKIYEIHINYQKLNQTAASLSRNHG